MFGGPRPQKGQGAGKPPLLDLPPNMRMMFEPMDPIVYKPPLERRTMPAYSGVAQLVNFFEKDPPPKPKSFETPKERKEHHRQKLNSIHKEKIEVMANDWDPHSNAKATENAYLTLFVGKLSYETTEKKLRREFEQFGPIKSIKVVQDLEGKPRGYAFIEFENEADMTNAYRKTNGKKIDGKRIVCDVERGRTVRNWRPMRFGGGLGGRQAKAKRDDKQPLAASSSSAVAPTPSIEPRNGENDRRGGHDRSRERGVRDTQRDSRDRRGYRDSGWERKDRSRSRDRDQRPPRDQGRNSDSYRPAASMTGNSSSGHFDERNREMLRDHRGDRDRSGFGSERGRARSRDRR